MIHYRLDKDGKLSRHDSGSLLQACRDLKLKRRDLSLLMDVEIDWDKPPKLSQRQAYKLSQVLKVGRQLAGINRQLPRMVLRNDGPPGYPIFRLLVISCSRHELEALVKEHVPPMLEHYAQVYATIPDDHAS